MNRKSARGGHPMAPERHGTMKRTFRGALRPAAFGSDEPKTCHVTGAGVGDPGAKNEHVTPGHGSPRLVLVHARPEDSTAEGGTENAHPGPHLAHDCRLTAVATAA